MTVSRKNASSPKCSCPYEDAAFHSSVVTIGIACCAIVRSHRLRRYVTVISPRTAPFYSTVSAAGHCRDRWEGSSLLLCLLLVLFAAVALLVVVGMRQAQRGLDA